MKKMSPYSVFVYIASMIATAGFGCRVLDEENPDGSGDPNGFLTSGEVCPDTISPGENASLLHRMPVTKGTFAKFPVISWSGCRLHVALRGQGEQNGISVWSKQALTSDAKESFRLDTPSVEWPTTGKLDYTTPGTETTKDGTIYAAWVNNVNGVYFRKRVPGSAWTQPVTVAAPIEPKWNPKTMREEKGGHYFADIAVAADGRIIIVYKVSRPMEDGGIEYVVSSDSGLSWSEGTPVAEDTSPRANLFTGRGGDVGLVTGWDEIQVYRWKGSQFIAEGTRLRAGEGGNSNTFAADAQITIDHRGKFYVSWRTLDPDGIYVAEKEPEDSNWNITRLSDQTGFGAVGISVDQRRMVHVVWAEAASRLVVYRYRRTDGSYSERVVTPFNAGFLTNIDMTSFAQNRSYAFAVFERWPESDGESVYSELFTFSAGQPNADPKNENK